MTLKVGCIEVEIWFYFDEEDCMFFLHCVGGDMKMVVLEMKGTLVDRL